MKESEQGYHYLTKAQRIFVEIEDQRGEAWSLFNLGELCMRSTLHTLEEAKICLMQSLALFTQISDRTGEGAAQSRLGNIASRTGHWISAREHLRQAFLIFIDSPDPHWKISTLRFISDFYEKQKQFEVALAALLLAATYYEKTLESEDYNDLQLQIRALREQIKTPSFLNEQSVDKTQILQFVKRELI